MSWVTYLGENHCNKPCVSGIRHSRWEKRDGNGIWTKQLHSYLLLSVLLVQRERKKSPKSHNKILCLTVLNILLFQINRNEIPFSLSPLPVVLSPVQERAVNTLTYRCTWSLPELRLGTCSGADWMLQLEELSPHPSWRQQNWSGTSKKEEENKREIHVFNLIRWWLFNSHRWKFSCDFSFTLHTSASRKGADQKREVQDKHLWSRWLSFLFSAEPGVVSHSGS